MTVLLTLICPIYKVREYVPELVDSLIAGLRSPDVTVIFVDDASPDDSLALCVDLLAQRGSDVCFRAVFLARQHNGGQSAARNSGLLHADGRYIGFIDADDTIDAHYLEVLVPFLQCGRGDIVEFAYQEFSGAVPAPRGLRGRVLASDQLNPYLTGFFSWTRIYRRELLAGLQFPEGRIFEDVRFVTEAFARAGTVHRISNVLVNYRRRPGSTTTVTRDHRYAHQLINLVDGVGAALPGFQDPARAAALTARKAFVILLKGARIQAADERRRFFSDCRAPLRDLRQLCRGARAPGWGRAWLGSGIAVAWLGQRV